MCAQEEKTFGNAPTASFLASLHQRDHNILCQLNGEGYEVTLPNEAYTARTASSTGKNAETAGEILPLTETSICLSVWGATRRLSPCEQAQPLSVESPT